LVNKISELGFGDRLHLSAGVSKINLTGSKIAVSHLRGEFLCDRVVLALPARVALESIVFAPKLSAERIAELQAVATWMAGHAKVVVEYQTPFWRTLGFSGDVISQVGPLSEVHDASSCGDSSRPSVSKRHPLPANALMPEAFGLFGFIGLTPESRVKNATQLPGLVLQQLTRLFGDDARKPLNVHIHDWAREPFTATQLDQKIPNHHPLNPWSTTREPKWNRALLWSGSETAIGQSNGYLEGAVLSSKQTMKELGISN
jgi:monoamine oxidase